MIAAAVVGTVLYGGLLARKSHQMRNVALGHREDATSWAKFERHYSETARGVETDIQKWERENADWKRTIAGAEKRYAKDIAAQLQGIASAAIECNKEVIESLKANRTLWQNQAADSAAHRRYHNELAAKYERLARYPWLPVPLDPSPP